MISMPLKLDARKSCTGQSLGMSIDLFHFLNRRCWIQEKIVADLKNELADNMQVKLQQAVKGLCNRTLKEFSTGTTAKPGSPESRDLKTSWMDWE